MQISGHIDHQYGYRNLLKYNDKQKSVLEVIEIDVKSQ